MVLSQDDFRQQEEFRRNLRHFLHASELNARKAGLNPHQYQLLLAVRGMPSTARPSITLLAERLMIETHSVVELVDRCVKKGLAERFRDGDDKRYVFVRLTELGQKVVRLVAAQNRQEIAAALPAFMDFLRNLS